MINVFVKKVIWTISRLVRVIQARVHANLLCIVRCIVLLCICSHHSYYVGSVLDGLRRQVGFSTAPQTRRLTDLRRFGLTILCTSQKTPQKREPLSDSWGQGGPHSAPVFVAPSPVLKPASCPSRVREENERHRPAAKTTRMRRNTPARADRRPVGNLRGRRHDGEGRQECRQAGWLPGCLRR